MRIEDALGIINHKPKNIATTGFMVTFELREGGFLKSDHFPDKFGGEPLIKTEEDAWELARRFADNTTDKVVNIYVIRENFSPVEGYDEKIIRKYP